MNNQSYAQPISLASHRFSPNFDGLLQIRCKTTYIHDVTSVTFSIKRRYKLICEGFRINNNCLPPQYFYHLTTNRYFGFVLVGYVTKAI